MHAGRGRRVFRELLTRSFVSSQRRLFREGRVFYLSSSFGFFHKSVPVEFDAIGYVLCPFCGSCKFGIWNIGIGIIFQLSGKKLFFSPYFPGKASSCL
jgi:hypothetical protein